METKLLWFCLNVIYFLNHPLDLSDLVKTNDEQQTGTNWPLLNTHSSMSLQTDQQHRVLQLQEGLLAAGLHFSHVSAQPHMERFPARVHRWVALNWENYGSRAGELIWLPSIYNHLWLYGKKTTLRLLLWRAWKLISLEFWHFCAYLYCRLNTQ